MLTKYQVRFQRDLLTKFLYSKRPNLSPSTFTLYEYCLKSFVERYEISADGINSFLANLNFGNARGNYHQIITTFIRWLLKTGHLEDNPMDRVNKPRRAKRILTSVTEEQVQLLLGQVDNRRDRAIISLLFSSGMRLNELTNIKQADIDWDDFSELTTEEALRNQSLTRLGEIVRRLNEDEQLNQNLIRLNKYMEDNIRSYPEYGCWTMTPTSEYEVDKLGRSRRLAPSRELWDCYETIARHLLEPVEPMESKEI